MLKHLDIPKAALLLFLLVFCRSAFAVQIETTAVSYTHLTLPTSDLV